MFRLALRNVFRHKLRTALTLAAIMSGVVGLILSGGFIEDTLFQLREATIHSQLGHLQIYKTGYYAQGSQAPYKFMIDKPDKITYSRSCNFCLSSSERCIFRLLHSLIMRKTFYYCSNKTLIDAFNC